MLKRVIHKPSSIPVDKERGKVVIELGSRVNGKQKKLNNEEYFVEPFKTSNDEYPVYLEFQTGFTHSQVNCSIRVNLPTPANKIQETVLLGWEIVEKELAKRMTSENMTEVINVLNNL